LPEKLAMSGVISTVIDSWAFPGSITFSRIKAGFWKHLCGCLVAFQKHRYRDAGRLAAVTPGSICFHILHRLPAASRGVNLQKPLPRAIPTRKADFYFARSDLSDV
jgi:hypothetical protein